MLRMGSNHFWCHESKIGSETHPARLQSIWVAGVGQEQVLSRFDMAEQKNTVSRAQALVQVAPDGAATLVSLGKRPTGLRRHANAPWCGRPPQLTRSNRDSKRDKF